jgi:hypothetical protein
MWVFSPQLVPETFLILRRIQGDTIKNVRKSPSIALVRLTKLEFSRQIFEGGKPLKYQIPWQSAQWESQRFTRTGGQTDDTTLTLLFAILRTRLKTNPASKMTGFQTMRKKPCVLNKTVLFQRLEWTPSNITPNKRKVFNAKTARKLPKLKKRLPKFTFCPYIRTLYPV